MAFLKDDPREIPTYRIGEAAHYLHIPKATLRSWIVGREYPTKAGRKLFKPVVSVPSGQDHTLLLSFINLVEAHVLDALRRHHRVPLPKVRIAIEFLKRTFPSPHPLADQRFETDGIDLFLEKYGSLINLSQNGQLAMRAVLKAHLKRIQRDPLGLASKLYPFTQSLKPELQQEPPRFVVIDPFVSFGRPVLAGTGIVTTVIAERYKAGESIRELADDYGRQSQEIEEAIRCELEVRAA